MKGGMFGPLPFPRQYGCLLLGGRGADGRLAAATGKHWQAPALAVCRLRRQLAARSGAMMALCMVCSPVTRVRTCLGNVMDLDSGLLVSIVSIVAVRVGPNMGAPNLLSMHSS